MLRNNLGLVGWVVAGLLAAFLFSEQVTDRFSLRGANTQQEAKAGDAQQSIAKGNRPPPSTLKREAPPREYKPDCSDPKNADLCAQRRMAEAAEAQLYANWFGLFLLFGTLGFTGWAAWSAKRAAVATRDAANAAQTSAGTANQTLVTMRLTAERQLRAYVSVSGSQLVKLSETEPAEAVIRFRNSGQTPAYRCGGRIGTGFREFPFTGELKLEPMEEVASVVGPGSMVAMTSRADKAFSAAQIALFRAGKMAAYVYGEMNYVDAFGEKRTTQFRLYYGGGQGAVPGTALHYDKKGNEAT